MYTTLSHSTGTHEYIIRLQIDRKNDANRRLEHPACALRFFEPRVSPAAVYEQPSHVDRVNE